MDAVPTSRKRPLDTQQQPSPKRHAPQQRLPPQTSAPAPAPARADSAGDLDSAYADGAAPAGSNSGQHASNCPAPKPAQAHAHAHAGSAQGAGVSCRIHSCCAPGGPLHGLSPAAQAAAVLRQSHKRSYPKFLQMQEQQQHLQEQRRQEKQRQQELQQQRRKQGVDATAKGRPAAAAAGGGNRRQQGPRPAGAAQGRSQPRGAGAKPAPAAAAAPGVAGKPQQQAKRLCGLPGSHWAGGRQAGQPAGSGPPAGSGGARRAAAKPAKKQKQGFDFLGMVNSIGALLPKQPCIPVDVGDTAQPLPAPADDNMSPAELAAAAAMGEGAGATKEAAAAGAAAAAAAGAAGGNEPQQQAELPSAFAAAAAAAGGGGGGSSEEEDSGSYLTGQEHPDPEGSNLRDPRSSSDDGAGVYPAAAAAAAAGGGYDGLYSPGQQRGRGSGYGYVAERRHSGPMFAPYSPTADDRVLYSPTANEEPYSPLDAAAAGGGYVPAAAAAAGGGGGYVPAVAAAGGGYVSAAAAAGGGGSGGGYVPVGEGYSYGGGYVPAGGGGYVPAAAAAAAAAGAGGGYVPAAAAAAAAGGGGYAPAAPAAGRLYGYVPANAGSRPAQPHPLPHHQPQHHQQRQQQQQQQPPLLKLLKGGAAPGVLMPTVSDLAQLLTAKGVRGLKVLMDPTSFKALPPELQPCLDWLVAQGATIKWDAKGVSVPPPDQVNLLVVSAAVGVDGVIRYADYLVSGVVVVEAAFLHLLHSRRGQLSDADWGTAPRWLYFGGGVRVLLDATLLKAANADASARQQMEALLDALTALKQRLPASSPCGAYVSQHMLSVHGKLLHKWQLAGLLQPLQPLQGQAISCLSTAKQVLLQQNQLEQPQADNTAAAAAAAAAAGPGEQAGGPSLARSNSGRTPIPAPARPSTLRYMLVAVPDPSQDVGRVLTDNDRQHVLDSLASDKPRGVVVAYAARLLHFLGVLKQQLEG